jgi:hypothetical protein
MEKELKEFYQNNFFPIVKSQSINSEEKINLFSSVNSETKNITNNINFEEKENIKEMNLLISNPEIKTYLTNNLEVKKNIEICDYFKIEYYIKMNGEETEWFVMKSINKKKRYLIENDKIIFEMDTNNKPVKKENLFRIVENENKIQGQVSIQNSNGLYLNIDKESYIFKETPTFLKINLIPSQNYNTIGIIHL